MPNFEKGPENSGKESLLEKAKKKIASWKKEVKVSVDQHEATNLDKELEDQELTVLSAIVDYLDYKDPEEMAGYEPAEKINNNQERVLSEADLIRELKKLKKLQTEKLGMNNPGPFLEEEWRELEFDKDPHFGDLQIFYKALDYEEDDF